MAPSKPRTTLAWGAAMLAGIGSAAWLFARKPRRDTSGRGARTTPAGTRAVQLGYETTDISARLVGRILAGLAGVAVGSIAVLFLMIHLLRAADTAGRPALTAQQAAAIPYPGPTLQKDPDRDLRDLNAAQQGKLAGYAWADPAHSRARIPIERAMALVAGHSLEPLP